MTPPMHRGSLRNFSGGQNARTILPRKMPRVTDSPPVLRLGFSCHDLSPAEIASYVAYPSFPSFLSIKTRGIFLGRIVL